MTVVFEFETQYGVFRDALVFADEVLPDAATIEAMKQQRLSAWIASIEAASATQETITPAQE